MAQQEQKTCGEEVRREKAIQNQEDDYDVYLFWPSLSNRDVRFGDSPSSPLHGPISLHSESTDYDYSGLSSGPPSPLTFAPVRGCRSPSPLDLGAARQVEPENEPQVPKESPPAKYSTLFKIGK